MQNKPKVLLVYPGSKSLSEAIPLGLLYVAQSLLKINIDVSIIHMGRDNIKKIPKDNYLFVGISMLTGKMILNGLKVAKLIKEYNNKIPIVLGGIHPSLLPEESLKNKYVDIVVIGDGEETIKELAQCLLSNDNMPGVKGIAFKDACQNITINPHRELIDLNSLDIDMPYHLLGRTFLKNRYALPIHTSRGCPYRCSFCYSPAFNKRKYRMKSAERVADEIDYYYKKYNINFFDFTSEDEFFIDPFRFCEIFKILAKKGIKISWNAFCRINTFDRALNNMGNEFMQLLKDSNCYALNFGIESGSQRMLDEVIKKDIKVQQIYRTVDALKTYKIPHRLNFIFNYPLETEDDIKSTFDVIDRISDNNSYIALALTPALTPLPKTSILDILVEKYNFKIPTTLEGWGRYAVPISYRNVTWHTKEYAKMGYNFGIISSFPFHQNFESYRMYKEFICTSTDMYPSGYISYILTKIQRWRYKNKFYALNFEGILFFKLRNTFGLVGRYVFNVILKKYLPRKYLDMLREVFGTTARSLKKIKEIQK